MTARPSRRALIAGGGAALLCPGPAGAGISRRALRLTHHTTGEKFDAVYAENGAVLSKAREALNWLLRDHHENRETAMDPALFDLLWHLSERFRRARGAVPELVVTSAYRTEATNERLRAEGAARNSLHKAGQAVDLIVRGYGLYIVANHAQAVATGGLGLYWRDKFIHLDTGPRRLWYRRV
jgi:uncharacterized protein YcbK (DUF882 family)